MVLYRDNLETEIEPAVDFDATDDRPCGCEFFDECRAVLATAILMHGVARLDVR